MHVLVTGCTGFVGFHTVLALARAGHRVRLGVRSEEKMRRVFADCDIDLSDFSVGCITDPDAVKRAVDGVEAVVHCAAMVNLDAAMADEVRENNVGGTENVIGEAVRQGVKAIVYVSSISALYRPKARLDESSPYAEASTGYSCSKRDADKRVRDYIRDGAPIAITYPTGIIGPDDPGLSDGNEGIAFTFNLGFVETSGGNQFIDVRDLAEAHVQLLEKQCVGLYLVAGHYLTWPGINDLYETIIGRRVKRMRVPGGLLRVTGRLVDLIKRFYPLHMPLTYEASLYATLGTIGDDSKLREELGFEYRPLETTFRDTLHWLVEAGHVDRDWLRPEVLQDE